MNTRPRLNAGRHPMHSMDAPVLNFIVNFKTENDGIAPTLREICDNLGISSTSVASSILKRLESQGKIILWDEVSRGIKVVGGRWSLDEERS